MTGHAFFDADSCGRICLVLFHSLWQMGFAAMLAWLLGRKWRGGSVEWVYWAHVAALVVGLAAMPATYLLLADRAPAIQPAASAVKAPMDLSGSEYSITVAGHDGPPIILNTSNNGHLVLNPGMAGATAQGMWKSFAPWVVGIYAFGAAMMFARLGAGIVRTERMRRRATPITTGVAAAMITKIAKAWRLRGVPLVALAERIAVPTVIGLVRPMILLPASALTALTANELELILAHEIAHVRRLDLWVNLLQRLGEVVLFFNPAMWYLSRRISALREYCCDEAVCRRSEVTVGGAQIAYASALLRVVELAQPARLSGVNAAALAADGGSPSELRRRVAALLGEPMNEPLRLSRGGLLAVIGAAAIVVVALGSFQSRATAADAKPEDVDAVKAAGDVLKKAKESKQEMLKLPIRVVDPDGKPVANAKITPWALRSSQGHGLWEKGDKRTERGPEPVVTDDDGKAAVLYPKYENVSEKISTIGVSVNVDHPAFAYDDAEHIDVPLETKGPYQIKLKPGVDVEVRPLVDGKPTSLDDLFAIWSDGRSYKPDVAPEKMSAGTLKFRGLSPGKNSVLLVKMDGERPTYFSKIADFELKAGEPKAIDVPLERAVTVHGKVSDDVPRPIRAGWITTSSLVPSREERNQRAEWYSWSPIQKDGTFTIEGWPAQEPIQLTAICDGFVATDGKAPAVVKDPPEPAHDPYRRPQVFEPQDREPIEVPMTAMTKCTITAVDEDNKPVAGVTVYTCPNVQWWNDGSQIYGFPLVKGERALKTRDYDLSIDADAYADPFRGQTDAKGQLTMYVPGRGEDFGLISDVYELPIFLGVREVRVRFEKGKSQDVTLHLQPRGTEQLGDWDKLAGVVFGCSTREGRRICALPEVRQKMDEFQQRFRDGASQRDPKLLSEAYTTVADAFVGVGDKEEAAKWRAKAAVEAGKVKR